MFKNLEFLYYYLFGWTGPKCSQMITVWSHPNETIQICKIGLGSSVKKDPSITFQHHNTKHKTQKNYDPPMADSTKAVDLTRVVNLHIKTIRHWKSIVNYARAT